MKPEYILKLATTQTVNQQKPDKQQEPAQKRYVNPLAILKANQVGLSQEEIQNGSMLDNLAKITNNIKSGKIKTDTTKQAASVFDLINWAQRFTDGHRLFPITDLNSKVYKLSQTDYAQGRGPRGICDITAFLRSAKDSNVIKGEGQESLSINKKGKITTYGPGR